MAASSFFEDLQKSIKFAKQQYLHSNEAILKAEDVTNVGAIPGSIGKVVGSYLGNTQGALRSFSDDGLTGVRDFFKDNNGHYRKGAIAGTIAGTGLIGDVALRTGYGMTHDTAGDMDIVGIPFI